MANLPLQLPMNQLQSKWASQLNRLLANLLGQGQLLENQKLINGITVINHGLGRKLIGWYVVGINGAATIYDNQATNQMPNLTLSLTSNAAVTVNLWVF